MAELAAKGAARRAGELFASGEIETFDAAMVEAIRLGSWLAAVNAKASSYLGPAVRDALRSECHRLARTYLEQHAREFAELAGAKDHASAERIVRWLQKFGFIAPPPEQSG